MSDWIDIAEDFCGRFGWGARGRHIGISRMMNDSDKFVLTRTKVVAIKRPRGVLSGFLAIVPQLGYAVYLPPIAAKARPMRIRMRLSTDLLNHGAVFSAYVTRCGDDAGLKLILEDVLVWKSKPVWNTTPFDERWNGIMNLFVTKEWKNDPALQTITIVLASYLSIQAVTEPDEKHVLEFIPNLPAQKRLIWIPQKSESPGHAAAATTPHVAKRESGMGPDVYSIWKGAERIGIAVVRTLAISKALRAAPADMFPVKTVWNKMFEKWEIIGI